MKAILYQTDSNWTLEVKLGLGMSSYDEFDTPSKAVSYLIDKHGGSELNLTIQSLSSIESMEYDYAY